MSEEPPHGLITGLAFIVIRAPTIVKDKAEAINQLLLAGIYTCPAVQRRD